MSEDLIAFAPQAQPALPPSVAASLRQSQKEATRKRVIDAARELFETRGYPGTTIREIASAANVSVGSVFTTFASKGEILSHVMQARLEALYSELDRVAPHLRGSTADRLRSLFAIHFAFEAPRTRLFLSHIAATYDWTLSEKAQPYGHNLRLRRIIRDCLAAGVAQGDVDAGADLDEVVELLIAAYGWTYRLAAWNGDGHEAMTAAMDRQIGVIAAGFRARAA